MLRLENVMLRQGPFEISGNVDFTAGECTALIGPSGAGKSTVLAGIAGFLPAVSGRILWNDTDLAQLAPGARGISMLFQDGNVFPHLTVFQNVALGASPRLKLTASMKAEVTGALARVGLSGMDQRKPAELSGGQIARVALARALTQSCPLMLLDEPFAALGPALKVEMLDLVRDVARETQATVLMVSHDPSDAKRIADRCALVADGTVSRSVETEAFFAAPPAALQQYLGA